VSKKTKITVPAFEEPKRVPKGQSPLALMAAQPFAGKLRPKGWRGKVFGVVVHTTGSGLVRKAKAESVPLMAMAQRIYHRMRGCHYVIDYDGTIVQMANEDVEAWGVGVSEPKNKAYKGQVESVKGRYSGDWKKDLPKGLGSRWQRRWPGYANPLHLLPGTKTANSCFVHIELPPLNPSSFTDHQYASVARLVMDIADRNGWKGRWWRTPRLLGHEDLTPITRSNARGAWDPGALRARPVFDWDRVINYIFLFDVEVMDPAYKTNHDFRKDPKPDTWPTGYYGRYR
jgi:hypothetical protein